jgi:ATP-binding cassette subfamily C (CFTR/MRP) protein 1
MKDGAIQEQGSYNSLMKEEGEFKIMMNAYGGISEEIEHLKDATLLVERRTDLLREKEAYARIDCVMAKNKLKGGKDLIEKEERDVGAVKGEVWIAYMHAAGGYVVFSLVVLSLLINQASKIGNGMSPIIFTNSVDYWLVAWTNSIIPSFTNSDYIGIFWAWGGLQMLTIFVTGAIFAFTNYRAAKTLHMNAAQSILRAPISFYDVTPMGRVINRFSKDQGK